MDASRPVAPAGYVYMSAVIFNPSLRAASIRAIDAIHLGPVGLACRFEVIDLRWNIGFAADPNQLVDRLEKAVAFAADVRDVLAAILRRDFAEFDQLFGGRIECGRVDQRGSDPSAPASISSRTSARISSSCAGVACLSSSPMTCSRIVVAPMNDATF